MISYNNFCLFLEKHLLNPLYIIPQGYLPTHSTKIENFKQNVVAINLDLLNTVPRPIFAKFGKYKIVLWNRKYNNAWGSPVFSSMLQLGGLRHCMFKFFYDEPNPYSLVYCLMKVLTSNTTPKLMAEELGHKLYDTCWSKREFKDYDMETLI